MNLSSTQVKILSTPIIKTQWTNLAESVCVASHFSISQRINLMKWKNYIQNVLQQTYFKFISTKDMLWIYMYDSSNLKFENQKINFRPACWAKMNFVRYEQGKKEMYQPKWLNLCHLLPKVCALPSKHQALLFSCLWLVIHVFVLTEGHCTMDIALAYRTVGRGSNQDKSKFFSILKTLFVLRSSWAHWPLALSLPKAWSSCRNRWLVTGDVKDRNCGKNPSKPSERQTQMYDRCFGRAGAKNIFVKVSRATSSSTTSPWSRQKNRSPSARPSSRLVSRNRWTSAQRSKEKSAMLWAGVHRLKVGSGI